MTNEEKAAIDFGIAAIDEVAFKARTALRELGARLATAEEVVAALQAENADLRKQLEAEKRGDGNSGT